MRRILSLDGGGIRGLISLGILKKIEAVYKKKNPDFKFCDHYDLIGGSSTGAIIAASLALGMSVDDIIEKYLVLGPKIFGDKKGIFGYLLNSQKYDEKPLEKQLKKIFGKNLLFGDKLKIKTGLCIVTKRLDTLSTWSFINHPNNQFYPKNKDIPLWKIIRASTAAPTYFKPQLIEVSKEEKGLFIDGGVSMANNPALQLFLVATLKQYPYNWPTGQEKLSLLSLGTGSFKRNISIKKMTKSNVITWASILPDLFMEDANYFNQSMLQYMSFSPTSVDIDKAMGDLKSDLLANKELLHYIRYNADMNHKYLTSLGLKISRKKLSKLHEMDNADNAKILLKIGEVVGKNIVKKTHLK